MADSAPKSTRAVVAALGAVVAFNAAGATIEEAKEIVDRAKPLRCEILALEHRLKATPPESDEFARLTTEIGEAKKKLKLHYVATMDEYIAVMKTLPFEDRKAVYAYSKAVAGRCGASRRD